ncbi:unnamed protein product [Arabidopsis halleri]
MFRSCLVSVSIPCVSSSIKCSSNTMVSLHHHYKVFIAKII